MPTSTTNETDRKSEAISLTKVKIFTEDDFEHDDVNNYLRPGIFYTSDLSLVFCTRPLILKSSPNIGPPTIIDTTFFFGGGFDTFITTLTGDISSFTDAGGGEVLVTTTAANLLETGNILRIKNTTNYNDYYTITVVTTTTFKITETFNGDDGVGNWKEIYIGLQLFGSGFIGDGSVNKWVDLLSQRAPVGLAPVSVFQIRSSSPIDIPETGTLDSIDVLTLESPAIIGGSDLKIVDCKETTINTYRVINETSFNNTNINISGESDFFTIINSPIAPFAGESFIKIYPSATFNSGVVVNNNFSDSNGGSFFAPDSLKGDDPRIRVEANGVAQDSHSIAKMEITGNTDVTSLVVLTPTEINATWGDGTIEERFCFQDVCTFENTTNTMTTIFPHGLVDTNEVTFRPGNGGTLPVEILEGVTYFVVNATATTFQIESSVGAGVFGFTDNGTGVNYYCHVAGNNRGWIIYLGLEPINAIISGWVNMKMNTGTEKTVNAQVMKTDVSLANIEQGQGSPVFAKNNSSQASIVSDVIDLVNGEGLRVFVTNRDDSVGIIVTDSFIIVSKT